MHAEINKQNVMLQVIDTSPIITIRPRKIIKARVLQVGSDVEHLKAGDTVLAYNDGHVLQRGPEKVHLMNHYSVLVKFK